MFDRLQYCVCRRNDFMTDVPVPTNLSFMTWVTFVFLDQPGEVNFLQVLIICSSLDSGSVFIKYQLPGNSAKKIMLE